MYFKIMRSFWDFCFSNPDKINTNHIAIFCFIVEHCNRLGWKEKFGLPTMMACEAVGIKSVNTYSKAFNELVDMGLIKLIQKSKNQWSANVIAISIIDEPIDKALDTALIKHVGQHLQSTCDSTDTIIRPNTNYQIPNTNKTEIQNSNIEGVENSKRFAPPTADELKEHFISKGSTEIESLKFYEFYGSKGWMVGKNKMKDWKLAASGWIRRNNTPTTPQTQQASLYE
jgi:DNA-binding transcriptional regulator YhcF (GntR family)